MRNLRAQLEPQCLYRSPEDQNGEEREGKSEMVTTINNISCTEKTLIPELSSSFLKISCSFLAATTSTGSSYRDPFGWIEPIQLGRAGSCNWCSTVRNLQSRLVRDDFHELGHTESSSSSVAHFCVPNRSDNPRWENWMIIFDHEEFQRFDNARKISLSAAHLRNSRCQRDSSRKRFECIHTDLGKFLIGDLGTWLIYGSYDGLSHSKRRWVTKKNKVGQLNLNLSNPISTGWN